MTAALLAGVLGLTSACGSGDAAGAGSADTPEASAAATDWQKDGGPEWEALLEKARAEGEVTLAGSPALEGPLSKAFEADTGIKVNYVGGPGSANSARFDTEARAGSPSIDVIIGKGTQLRSLYKEELLEPLKPQMILPSTQDGPAWRGGKKLWFDPEEKYIFQGSAYVFGFVTVNADIVDPAEIKTWDDLLDPKYQGKIAAYDPTVSPSPGQGVAVAMMKGHGEDLVKKIWVDTKPTFYRDPQQLAQAVARGTQPIGLALTQSSLEQFRKEGINLQVIAPEPWPGYVTTGFGAINQAKKSPHPAAAQVFINWFASPAGQQVYQDTMLEASTRADLDVSSLPEYVVPKEGVEYFTDMDSEFYLNEQLKVTEKIVSLIGGGS
ncbi:extracellular solute-binding protein [Nonomuraea sp. NPDC049486]|uniref:ABC transporter substrate-binding protein n=1 Tax=Nonomuraea sp. NPDC049486 TaxID=3155773 RepID=UPI00341B124D